jgi:flagellar biosynthesis/type III secretory pathway protein FliH
MNDLFKASVPFTFDDFEHESARRPDATFISLFEPEPEEVEPVEAEAEVKPEPPPPPPPTAEDLARKAFDDAYVEGEKAGYDMGMRRAELLAKRLEKQIEEVTRFKKTLEDKYEKLAVDLAIVFAEAIILAECTRKRELIAGMIKKALEVCEGRGEIVVRVRGEDVRHIEGVGRDNIKIIADDTLGEPGFIIETSVGDIDGRMSSQIEELKNAVIGNPDG